MNILRCNDAHYSERLQQLASGSSLFDPEIEDRTRTILQAVATNGDAALLELTQRFDGAQLLAEQLAVTKAELLNASLSADDALREAVALASRNIQMFSRKSLRKNW